MSVAQRPPYLPPSEEAQVAGGQYRLLLTGVSGMQAACDPSEVERYGDRVALEFHYGQYARAAGFFTEHPEYIGHLDPADQAFVTRVLEVSRERSQGGIVIPLGEVMRHLPAQRPATP